MDLQMGMAHTVHGRGLVSCFSISPPVGTGSFFLWITLRVSLETAGFFWKQDGDAHPERLSPSWVSLILTAEQPLSLAFSAAKWPSWLCGLLLSQWQPHVPWGRANSLICAYS